MQHPLAQLGRLEHFDVGAEGQQLSIRVVEILERHGQLDRLTRRIATRAMQGPVVKTNVHALAGRKGVVTKAVSTDGPTGQVRIGGNYWSARPYFDDAPAIPEGARVEVLKIEGVTAIVMPVGD